MYAILAYMALFRLDEMGFPKFKEFAMTQDPTKVFNFINYLFNKGNLYSCLRAEWMKVIIKYILIILCVFVCLTW